MFRKKKNILSTPKVYNASDLNYTFGLAKKENRQKRLRFVKIIFLTVILAGIVFFVLFKSPIFEIKNIIVEGGTQEITSKFNDLKRKNIFLFNKFGTQDYFKKQYPEIGNLKIIRGLPNTLKIVISWRTDELIWQTDDKFYCVDNTGIIYSECIDLGKLPQVKDTKGLPVKLGQQIISTNFINFISELKANISQVPDLGIVSYEVEETTFQVNALTNRGWKVIFDTTRSAKNQIDQLNTFLKDHQAEVTEYIDLRVDGRAYYK